MTLWALSYYRKDDHDDFDHCSLTTNVTKDLDNAFISAARGEEERRPCSKPESSHIRSLHSNLCR